jgi:hypothetical protein
MKKLLTITVLSPAILINLSLNVCVMKMIVVELSNQLMIIIRLSEVN